MYELCSSLNRESNAVLWMQILGYTDLMIHSKISDSTYDEGLSDIVDEVMRLNPHIYNREATLNPERESQQEGEGLDLFKSVSLKTRNKEVGTIMYEADIKLMLLRHWTLFESISNSSYMVSKFQLWKEPG
jgi:cell division control protein 45